MTGEARMTRGARAGAGSIQIESILLWSTSSRMIIVGEVVSTPDQVRIESGAGFRRIML